MKEIDSYLDLQPQQNCPKCGAVKAFTVRDPHYVVTGWAEFLRWSCYICGYGNDTITVERAKNELENKPHLWKLWGMVLCRICNDTETKNSICRKK